MNPVIMVAAIFPIVVSLTLQGQSSEAVWLDIGSWIIFIADFVVHLRWKPGYLQSGVGKFDLSIVVLTAPWFLIPGLGNTRVLGLARLGRLGRVFVVSAKSPVLQKLGQRLGGAALYGLVLMLCCALIVYRVEPESSGFATYGDAMWWAIVTFTTVGYGDFFPVTSAGRFAAMFLMIGGVALIGTLAATLGSFFAGGGDADKEPAPPEDTAATGGAQDELLGEVRLLRAEIAELRGAADGP